MKNKKDLTVEEAADEAINIFFQKGMTVSKAEYDKVLAILRRIKCPACEEIKTMNLIEEESEYWPSGYNICLDNIKAIISKHEGSE